MPSIGGVTCDRVHGILPAVMVEEFARTTRPGINGEGIWLEGLRAADCDLRAVLFGTRTTCILWAAAMEALQGTFAVVVTDAGQVATLFLAEVRLEELVGCVKPGTTIEAKAVLAVKGLLAT